ncbi:MAG: hypothetical protein V5A57_01245 [Candidatus Paceibacterota bacterium]
MKITAKVVIGVLVVLLLGLGGALATKTWNPSWNPFAESPQKIIEKMAEAQRGVDSSHINGTFKAETDEGSVEVEFEADGDSSDSKNLKSKVSFDASISMEGTQFSTKGEARMIDNIMYVKVNEIPAAPMLPVKQISQFKNQWIKLGSQKKEQTEQEEIDSEKAKNIIKKYVNPEKLFEVKKVFSTEKVKGVMSYHYLVALNEKEMKESIPPLVEELRALNNDQEPVDKDKIRKDIDEFFDEAAPVEAELWIGKKDYLLRKFKFSKEFDAQEVAEKAEASRVDLSLEAYFSDFGKEVQVEKPEGAKTIQELMMSIMQGSIPGIQDQTSPMPDNIPEDYEVPEGTDVPQF